MAEKFKRLLPSIGAGLVFAVSMIPNIPNLPSPLGISLSVWVIGVLLIVQIVVDNTRISDLERTRPNIVPDITVYDSLESAFPLWNKGVHTKYLVKRYYLPFRNIQPDKDDLRLIDTEAINAKVSFYDKQSKEFFRHEKAFWFNAKPRVFRQSKEDHIFKIPASGEAEGVCLIIRKEGDSDIYIFNDDSYFPGTPSIVLDKSMKISQKSFLVCVELTMANHKIKPVWVRITNKGKTKPPLFELVDSLN